MQQGGTFDDLQAHRRMRACLEGIRHLDPEGVAHRIKEVAAEIARLEALFGIGAYAKADRAMENRAMEIVSIGSRLVRAA